MDKDTGPKLDVVIVDDKVLKRIKQEHDKHIREAKKLLRKTRIKK